MNDRMDYRDVAALADAKKARFLENVGIARLRVSPARLKSDAKAGIKNAANSAVDKTKRTVREHPIATTVAGVGLFAFVFRRPLWALIIWAKGRRSGATDDAGATDQNFVRTHPATTQPQPEISDEERY